MNKEIQIADVAIPPRARKDPGDVSGLAQSIEAVGLLHPIVVTPAGTLIVGERRLLAAKLLGWVSIPATVARSLDDALSALLAERDENTCRLDLRPSECVAVAQRLELLERKAAKERQAAGQKSGGRGKKKLSPKLGGSNQRHAGESGRKIASAVGMGASTLRKAQEVCEAAKADPKLTPLVERMDKSGKVDRAHKELKQVQRAQQRQSEAAATPAGCNVVTGRFQDLIGELEPCSVDLIFTDPPYDQEASSLYADLSGFAAAVLRPGGLCLAMSGQSFLPEALAGLSSAMEYVWCCAIRHTGGELRFRKWNLRNAWKPIVLCGKPPVEAWWEPFSDMASGGKEKSEHDWQQAEAEAAHFITALCPVGGIVADPMCGSGTTLAAAKRLGRRWWGCDCDAGVAAAARKRLDG